MAAPVPKVRMMNGLPMDKNGHLLKRPVVYDRLPRVNWAEVAGPWLAEEFLDFDRQHGLTKERVMRRLRREPPRTTEAALPEPPTSPEPTPCVVTSTGRASAGATKTATTTVKMPTPTSSADLSSARGRRRARWRLKDMKCTVVDPADRVLVFSRRRAPRTAMPRVVRVQASEPFVVFPPASAREAAALDVVIDSAPFLVFPGHRTLALHTDAFRCIESVFDFYGFEPETKLGIKQHGFADIP